MTAALKLEPVARAPMALVRAIDRMRAAGFVLAIENGGLAISPASRLSDEQRDFIRAHKVDLVALIEKSERHAGRALAILRTLHDQHIANLVAGGHDGKGALVRRDDYWRIMGEEGIPPTAAFDLLDQGRARTQAEGLYWMPVQQEQQP